MMSGVPLETCSAFNKLWNNKFYYKVASCWLFLLVLCNIPEKRNILLTPRRKPKMTQNVLNCLSSVILGYLTNFLRANVLCVHSQFVPQEFPPTSVYFLAVNKEQFTLSTSPLKPSVFKSRPKPS